MNSSRRNALAELKGGRLIFTLLYGARPPKFHTILSSYFTTATQQLDPLPALLYSRVGRVKLCVILSRRYSFKSLTEKI